MVALRAPYEPDDASEERPSQIDRDWLTLPQAACEMGVSISTVRRLLRTGRLRNRIVPRRGGFKYLIYIPGSRHAAGGALHLCSDADPAAPIDIEKVRQKREINELQRQVEELSGALTRAMRSREKGLPARGGAVADSPDAPYARYRWLVRKRRWWPFD